MDPIITLVVLPGGILLVGIAIAFWALNRDRSESTGALRRLNRILEQNRTLRAYTDELTAWGMYSTERPPRTPPPRPLALENDSYDG